MRKRFGTGIQRDYLGARVDARLVADLMTLVRRGVVPNKSEGVERGLKLLLAVHRDEIAAETQNDEIARVA